MNNERKEAWYCPQCDQIVPDDEVTFEETHDSIGCEGVEVEWIKITNRHKRKEGKMDEKERKQALRNLITSLVHDLQSENDREELIELTMKRGYSETDSFFKLQGLSGPRIRLVMIKGE